MTVQKYQGVADSSGFSKNPRLSYEPKRRRRRKRRKQKSQYIKREAQYVATTCAFHFIKKKKLPFEKDFVDKVIKTMVIKYYHMMNDNGIQINHTHNDIRFIFSN